MQNLTELIDTCGREYVASRMCVPPEFLKNWENGSYFPHSNQMKLLADVLKVDFETLCYAFKLQVLELEIKTSDLSEEELQPRKELWQKLIVEPDSASLDLVCVELCNKKAYKEWLMHIHSTERRYWRKCHPILSTAMAPVGFCFYEQLASKQVDD